MKDIVIYKPKPQKKVAYKNIDFGAYKKRLNKLNQSQQSKPQGKMYVINWIKNRDGMRRQRDLIRPSQFCNQSAVNIDFTKSEFGQV